MTLALEDNEKALIYLCDEHAEDTTPKKAKEAFLDRKKKLNDLLEQAKLLGFDLTTTQSGLVIDAPRKAAPVQQTEVISENIDSELVDSKIFDNARMNIRVNNSAGADGGNAYDTSALGPGKAKPEIVNIRGIDMVIPAQKIDQTGTTTIRINNVMDDNTMQRRFKQIANNSMNDNITSFAEGDGYKTKTCPMCGGKGSLINRGKSQLCAKCDGTGEINV
jgi:hypothetical protein